MTIDPCADNDDDFAASKISKEESWDFFCWLMMFWCFQAFQIMFLNQILDWCSNASSFVKEIPMQVSSLFCLMGTLGGCCCCCCSVFVFWNWISFGRHPFGRLWKKLVALGGPKYKARGFEHLLSKFFDDDLYLDSTLTSVLIPAFDIKLQQPVFFSSWKVKKKSHPLPSPTPNPS